MGKRRVLATGSLWSLLIYMIISELEVIKKTKYFFSKAGIHKSVRKNLECVTFGNSNWNGKHRLMMLYYLIAPIVYRIKYPYLLNSDFYCIDQGFDIMSIVGRNNYTLIEDGLGDYIERDFAKVKSFKDKLYGLLYGPMYNNSFGNNRLCNKIILTMNPTTKVMFEKGYVVNLNDLWSNSSAEKKKYILSVFNLSESDLSFIQSKKVLLLTQPLSEDKIISEEKKISIYREIVNRFGEDNVLIKIHPREKTDYRTLFPNAIVFDKIVPMQLFNLLNVSFETVATISSTAAVSFINGKTNVYFEGTEKYPEIAARYGKITYESLLQSMH